jgi:hypothetical protein
MTKTTRWWRPSQAARRRNDAWARNHPVRYGLICGCGLAILSFGINFSVQGRPTSLMHLVGLAVAAIVGGLVGGLVFGAFMTQWFKRHEHNG